MVNSTLFVSLLLKTIKGQLLSSLFIQDQRGEFRNLPETFKRNPAAVVQLRNMTPSWNVGKRKIALVSFQIRTFALNRAKLLCL